MPLSEPQISALTIEKAAAAKAALEARYANLNSAYENPAADPHHLRRLRALKTRAPSNTPPTRMLEKNDIAPLRTLGKGSFGIVKLVRHVPTNKVLAMKVMNKEQMLLGGQEAHLKAERDLLVRAARERSQWIVPLLQSFQDVENLYLLMEYTCGGDFLGFLLREDELDEASTNFYATEMICALRELHTMKWVHRDLKPDNFLISASGHLKISDFGLAFSGERTHQLLYYTQNRTLLCEKLGVHVMGDLEDMQNSRASDGRPSTTVECHARGHPAARCYPDDRTVFEVMREEDRMWKRRTAHSVVGTSQYMAPEVIAGLEYDARCDLWSLGIIVYECLYGGTPFYDSSKDMIKLKIASWPDHLHFLDRKRVNRPHSDSPKRLEPVSLTAKQCICRLLTYARERASIFDIMSDPWFAHVDWERVGTYPPPFVPEISGDEGRYFEAEDQIGNFGDIGKKRARDKILRDPVHGPIAMDVRKKSAFLGYTFRRSDMRDWVGDEGFPEEMEGVECAMMTA